MEFKAEITGEFPSYSSSGPHKIVIHGYNTERRELSVAIDGEKKQIPIEDNNIFNPVTLGLRHVGFPHIEHPIRDDLEHDHSIIRAKLKQALEPHGITVTNHC